MTERDDAQPRDPADRHLGDEVVDLALGHVAGARRAEMVGHLLACPRCRATYDELVAALDDVVTAAPEVQPPLGFDERTLDRMGVGPASATAPPGGSSSRRRWVPLGAAAAVLAVAALALGVLIAGGGDASDDAEARVATLRTTEGEAVGTATRTEVDGAEVLVVGLAVGDEGAAYTCRMRFADGSTLDAEPWTAAPGAAWLVPLPGDRGALEDVALVGVDGGATWSTATF